MTRQDSPAGGRAGDDDATVGVEHRAGADGAAHVDPHRDELNVVTEWTGPVGTAAGAAIFAVATWSWIPDGRLLVWLALIGVAVALMIAGTGRGRTADRVGLVGHGLVGVLWGGVLLLGLDGSEVDDRYLWAALAFQFATSAGVALGTTIDERGYGPAVLLAMWPISAFGLLFVGQPVLAIGVIVFLAIIMRDVRSTSTVIEELLNVRAAEAGRAREARWLAVHDPLTGVANRTGVAEALDGHRKFGAAFFIDLDYFKEINDRLGHHAGDQVLVEVARRIESLFRDGDVVARLGGDEFVALVDATAADDDQLMQRASDIIGALERPMTDIATEQVYLSASIGITHLDHGDALEQVLHRSDHAMYEAKRLGRRCAVIFGDEHRRAGQQRSDLSMAVRRAIREGEIEAWGQPIFCFETRQIVAVELLARWRRADAYVSPAVFIPIAERIGMTADLTRMMLGQATAVLADWSRHDLLAPASIAINVSPADLRTRTLVDDIDRLLAAGRLAPHRLVLEITESSGRANVETMHSMLAPLRAQGVSVALDDFGSGHSSFNGVRDLGVDAVKLHQSIIHRLDDGDQETEVVGSIARLAEALGRDIIAEGVETDTQVKQLLHLGFHLLQGYAICEPMPVDDLGGTLGRQALDRLVARYDAA